MRNYLLTRLREASTWRGLALLLTALGVELSPQHVEAIVAAGVAVVGAIGVFLPDRLGAQPQPQPQPAAAGSAPPPDPAER